MVKYPCTKHSGIDSFDYWCCIFLSHLYFIILIKLDLTSKSKLKRTLAIVFFGMNTFSTLVYFLLYLGITPKLYGPLGIPIQTVRFIDWNLSLPCLLDISSLIITGKPIDGNLDTKAQIFIFCLLISSGQLTPLSEVIGGLGIFIIGTILLDFAKQFTPVGGSKTADHETISNIKKIVFWTLSLIAITWILGLTSLFRFPETELLYSITDAGFKCGFTALVLSIDKIQNIVTA